MPIGQQPPEVRQFDLENAPFKFGSEPLEEARALETVRRTFDEWSGARQNSHEKRWISNDRLYLGLVEKKMWGDNKTPRHALGIPVSFDQIESVYPIITRSLFGRQDWIGVESTVHSSPQEARALGDALLYQLTTPQDRSGTTSLMAFKTAVKEILQRGHGVVELGYRPDTGNGFVDHIPVKDFFFDPTLGTPLIDRATAVIVRKHMTAEQLETLRGVSGYKVPSPQVMAWLIKNTPESPTKGLEDSLAAQRKSYQNLSIGNPVPAKQKIEVLQYWTEERVIWVLNRKMVCFNQPNPYGFLPFAAAPCIMLPGEAYGISMPDMLEGEQLLIQGATNAALDKLALELFPPRYRQSMNGLHPMQEAWKPGMIADARDLKGVEVLFPPNSGTDVFGHIQMAEARSRRRFGVSEMAMAGTPTPSNANRTAGGVRSQESATSSRIGTIIENIEDYLLVPALYKLQAILNRWVPQSLPQVPTQQEGQQTLAPRSILGTPVRFKLVGASNLAARGELLNIMGPVSQTLLSDPVMKAAQAQGQTMDFSEWSRFFLDATTGQRYGFFRQMREEELQAQQQPPAEVMADIQKVQMEGEIRQGIMQQKIEGELRKTAMQAESASDQQGEKSALEILKLLNASDTERGKLLARMAAEAGKNEARKSTGAGGPSK